VKNRRNRTTLLVRAFGMMPNPSAEFPVRLKANRSGDNDHSERGDVAG
jgi:hypothetical protein